MKLEVITAEAVSEARPTPILFVHGMWHGAWCWAEHFLPYFAGQGYTAHALSVRGHGDSEGRERLRWTSLADYVADVAQVAGGLPRPPVLVGHSMGGAIVQKYLESHQAPAAVLLAAVPPKGVIPATVRFAARHPLAFLKANLTLSMWPVVGTPALCKEFLFAASIADGELAAHFARLQDESYRAYWDMMILNLPHPRRVQTPMLVLGATDDMAVSRREVEATARAYGVPAEFFDMAHDMMLEPGWQAVADRILGWLGERGL
jgi:alpha-beta hydrolase superfamily lysophospholipase